ncbi:MAG: hypothetical protein MJ182_09515 [Treponema sp.]|nr:hypothetical protein [Treponema sp.]
MNKFFKTICLTLFAFIFLSCTNNLSDFFYPKSTGEITITLPGTKNSSFSRKIVSGTYTQDDVKLYEISIEGISSEYHELKSEAPGSVIKFESLKPGDYKVNAVAYKLDEKDEKTEIAKIAVPVTTTVEAGKTNSVKLKLIALSYEYDDGTQDEVIKEPEEDKPEEPKEPEEEKKPEEPKEPEEKEEEIPEEPEVTITEIEIVLSTDFISFEEANKILRDSEHAKNFFDFKIHFSDNSVTEPKPLSYFKNIVATMPAYTSVNTGNNTEQIITDINSENTKASSTETGTQSSTGQMSSQGSEKTPYVGNVPFTFEYKETAGSINLTEDIPENVSINQVVVPIKYPLNIFNSPFFMAESSLEIPAFGSKVVYCNDINPNETALYEQSIYKIFPDGKESTVQWTKASFELVYPDDMPGITIDYDSQNQKTGPNISIWATPDFGNDSTSFSIKKVLTFTPGTWAYVENDQQLYDSEVLQISVVPYSFSTLTNSTNNTFEGPLCVDTYSVTLNNSADKELTSRNNLYWSVENASPSNADKNNFSFKIEELPKEEKYVTLTVKDDRDYVLCTKDYLILKFAEANEYLIKGFSFSLKNELFNEQKTQFPKENNGNFEFIATQDNLNTIKRNLAITYYPSNSNEEITSVYNEGEPIFENFKLTTDLFDKTGISLLGNHIITFTYTNTETKTTIVKSIIATGVAGTPLSAVLTGNDENKGYVLSEGDGTFYSLSTQSGGERLSQSDFTFTGISEADKGLYLGPYLNGEAFDGAIFGTNIPLTFNHNSDTSKVITTTITQKFDLPKFTPIVTGPDSETNILTFTVRGNDTSYKHYNSYTNEVEEIKFDQFKYQYIVLNNSSDLVGNSDLITTPSGSVNINVKEEFSLEAGDYKVYFEVTYDEAYYSGNEFRTNPTIRFPKEETEYINISIGSAENGSQEFPFTSWNKLASACNNSAREESLFYISGTMEADSSITITNSSKALSLIPLGETVIDGDKCTSGPIFNVQGSSLTIQSSDGGSLTITKAQNRALSVTETGYVSITNVNFKDNYTYSENGGAVYIGRNSADDESAPSVQFNSCEFTGNLIYGSASSGGALYVAENSNSSNLYRVNINDCVFNGNTSCDKGGAIYLNGRYVNTLIKNTKIYENQLAIDPDSETRTINHIYGAGLALESGTLSLENIQAYNNYNYYVTNPISNDSTYTQNVLQAQYYDIHISDQNNPTVFFKGNSNCIGTVIAKIGGAESTTPQIYIDSDFKTNNSEDIVFAPKALLSFYAADDANFSGVEIIKEGTDLVENYSLTLNLTDTSKPFQYVSIEKMYLGGGYSGNNISGVSSVSLAEGKATKGTTDPVNFPISTKVTD